MTFSLDKALQSISERAETQEVLSEGIGRIDPNTPEVERRRLRQLEVAVLGQIAFLQGEPDSELKTTRLNVALDRLGELRAEQGDYVGAIGVTKSPTRSANYEKIQQAIDRGAKGPACECPSAKVRDGREIVSISPRFKIQTIQTQNGPRNLMMCATCKKLYVE